MDSCSGVRVPLTWNDRAVLSFEPIQVGFATRHTVAAIRNYKKSSFNWDEDMEKEIARDVLRKHGGLEIAQAWLDIAFDANEHEIDEIRSKRITPTPENLEAFVHFFWLIFQNNESGALHFLNNQRKLRGFMYTFNINASGSGKILTKVEGRSGSRSTTDVESGGDFVTPGRLAEDNKPDIRSLNFEEAPDETMGNISDSSEEFSLASIVKSSSLRPADAKADLAPRGPKKRTKVLSSSGHSSPMMISEDDVVLEDRRKGSRSFPSSGRSSPMTISEDDVAPAKKTKDLPLPHSLQSSSSDRSSTVPSRTHARVPINNNSTIQASSVHVTRPKTRVFVSNSDIIREPVAPSPVRPRATSGKRLAAEAGSSKHLGHGGKSRRAIDSLDDAEYKATASKSARSVSSQVSNHHSAFRENEISSRRVPGRNRSDSKLGRSLSAKFSTPIRQPKQETEPPVRPIKQRRPSVHRTNAPGESKVSDQGTNRNVNNNNSTAPLRFVTQHDTRKVDSKQSSHELAMAIPIDRSQASSKSSTANVIASRKRKMTSHSYDSRYTGLFAVVQSELRDLKSRPMMNLPVRRRSWSDASTGQLPEHSESKSVSEFQDAATSVQDPPKPLANWITDDDPENRPLETMDESYSDMKLWDDVDVSTVVTIRDHEKDPRPKLDINPPIWAQSRQEVCETTSYFRSYQGGVYFANNLVKGYLLSAFASTRDIFHHDGRLIISHGGGKSESIHSREGRLETQMAEDQLAQDKSVRALLCNYTAMRPLVLLADDRYKFFPYNLLASGYTYVVLGYYYITHAWAEYQSASNERGRVVRYKFAFQWCECQGDPWWLKGIRPDGVGTGIPCEKNTAILPGKLGHDEPSPLPASRQPPIKNRVVVPSNLGALTTGQIYNKCEHCKFPAPQVYQQGWMCLKPECTAFFTLKHGESPGDALVYHASFLELRSMPALAADLPSLCPPPPPTEVNDDVTTTFVFSKGWHCPQCGRLSSRYKWAYWECANCKEIAKTKSRLRQPKEFWGQVDLTSNHQIGSDSGILKPYSKLYNDRGIRGEYISYILPHGRGKIHLIRGNPRANADADAIFQRYQEQAASEELPFQRYPLRAHKCRGTLLTNYFSQNCGEPYQYVGGTDSTVPFSSAPSAVLQALKLIQIRAQAVLGTKPQFNEILSAAYMERQKMAFHSDSERGLGPVVASLSMGSAAMMHFRVHAQQRREGEGKETALTLILRHGDVLIMDGACVQECYEHAVVPYNFRIAATARQIGGN